jgi:hypothetical protein
MRLPAYEHLRRPLRAPLETHTVGDLLNQVARRHFAVVRATGGRPGPLPDQPTAAVIDATRQALQAVRAASVRRLPEQLLWETVAELTVLGWDLQQAIGAGAGLDPLLLDVVRPYCADPPVLNVWPGLAPLDVPALAPIATQVLGAFGRRVEPEPG